MILPRPTEDKHTVPLQVKHTVHVPTQVTGQIHGTIISTCKSQDKYTAPSSYRTNTLYQHKLQDKHRVPTQVTGQTHSTNTSYRTNTPTQVIQYHHNFSLSQFAKAHLGISRQIQPPTLQLPTGRDAQDGRCMMILGTSSIET